MATRDETKAWVQSVLTHLGMKPTELARKIERAPSTLNRFLNDPEAAHDLSPDTVERIATFAKIRPYELPDAEARRTPGMAEAEAIPFGASSTGDVALDEAVRLILRNRNGVDAWHYRSTGLTVAGYLPGDLLLVDLNGKPRPHDVVCAQVYDWRGGRAQTVFRLYEPPYLLASTTDVEMLRPLVVDDDTVVIKGVVVTSLRPRRVLGLAA